MKILPLFFILITFISCQNEKTPLPVNGTEFLQKSELQPFYHGVASGDPLADRVIIWTRVTPENHQSVKVNWEVANDDQFKNIVSQGSATTDSLSDYTVKVDATGLTPNSQYYYRFKALSATSQVGKTRTLNNTGVGDIKLGIVSCSNYEFGYFGAYRHLADKELDAVVHLGDYFYEYGPGVYGDTIVKRYNIPPYEILTLSDYRTRYAQYRLDKDLQLVHQRHPFISIWDDHEIANNAHTTGGQNHQEDEGDYQDRKNAAKQAYYEWLPIRSNSRDALYRDFNFGSKADLIVLDERLAGRSAPVETVAEVDGTLTMLGAEQLEWFKEKLSSSEATWKIIGNQVIFSELDLSDAWGVPRNLDAWDGYAVERDDMISHIVAESVDDVIFVTGDTHTSWAFEVPVSITDYKKTSRSVAIELGTTSVSSGNWNERESDANVILAEGLVHDANPHLKYVNGRDHGYLLLTLSDKTSKAEWYFVNDVTDLNTDEYIAKSVRIESGSPKLILSED